MQVRRARAEEAAEIAGLWTRSRVASAPQIPLPVHREDEVCTWFRDAVLPSCDVWVVVDEGVLVAVLVLKDDWIDQLYVEPGRTGGGIGAELLAVAKRERPSGLRLSTFATNVGARRFYESHGFSAAGSSLGDNEEGAPDVRYEWSAESPAVPIGPLVRRLTHPRLLTRFGTLLVMAITVFVVCWSLAYLFLPLGVLRGRTAGAALAGGTQAADSLALEWLRLFAVNSTIVGVMVVGSNLLRTRRGVPLGYWTALVMIAAAAVVTGTNSFSVQAGTATKLAPSLDVLGQPGPYELASYVLATTAAYGFSRWQLAGRWPHSKVSRLPPAPVRGHQLGFGLAAAGLILAVTAAWEAARIVAVTG